MRVVDVSVRYIEVSEDDDARFRANAFDEMTKFGQKYCKYCEFGLDDGGL